MYFTHGDSLVGKWSVLGIISLVEGEENYNVKLSENGGLSLLKFVYIWVLITSVKMRFCGLRFLP